MAVPTTSHRDGRNGYHGEAEDIELPAVRTPPALAARRTDPRLPSIKPLEEYPTKSSPDDVIAVRSIAAGGFATSQIANDSDLLDEHVHISAHLYGWDNIRDHFPDPAFERLEAIDQALIGWKDFASRLAILLIAKIWKYRDVLQNGSDEIKSRVPPWYWALPCQAGLPSHHIFHCFPWPGIRELLCRKAYEYEVNDPWFATYIAHYRVAWPLDIDDAIELSPITGMRQFTPAFRACLLDIRNWTFESDFFEAYPDFQGVANKFEPQLAVTRLHNRTAAHELTMRRATRDERVRRLLQEYYDRTSQLRAVAGGNKA